MDTGPMNARPRAGDERGAISPFVIGVSFVLLICAGLVYDGGTALNAKMRLADSVEQAARAGSDQADLPSLYGRGQTTIDPIAARQAALAYMATQDASHVRVYPTTDSVTVTATDRVDTVMLRLIGFRSFQIEASATSIAEEG